MSDKETVHDPCRWCGKSKSEKSDGMTFKTLDPTCPHCGAWVSATIVAQTNSQSVHLWHNPDNSLFVEFVGEDGKTARYNLSAEQLLKTGALQLFDGLTEGKKTP